MPKEINLLPKKSPGKEKELAVKKILNWIGGAILGVFLLLVSALFIFGGVLTLKASSLKQDIGRQEEKIQAERIKESLSRGLKIKLAAASKILAGSYNLGEKLNNLKDLTSSLSLTNVSLSENQVSFSVRTSSLPDLGNLLETLDKGEILEEIKLSNLTLNEEGIYNLSIEALWKSKP